MFDLSSPHMQPFDLFSSRLSSTSSTIGSIESSLDSITLSGDERELGKVCVRLSYQEALEQVWITLVQSSDLYTFPDGGEQPKIGFKGIITIPKPIQFKSSIKEYQQDVSFMETFVFALRLQQLRCSALVLRLQTHNPKKRTVAECVLSLRQLDSQETEHWLELNLKSKSSVCHSELQSHHLLSAVNGRHPQLQMSRRAKILQQSSSPLTKCSSSKVEMHQLGRWYKEEDSCPEGVGGAVSVEERFHFMLAQALDQPASLTVLNCTARSSVAEKTCLGQVQAGFDSPVPEAVEQWKDTMANPEKVVSAWHTLSAA
ncbi:tandem C2 domains nuclear protein [Notothenia coriiceps]|uniref:Tandem C2 domains nuclear protein n=1 Tax=Notothenia coriiceps TaxID=8208 RepID=A0A6I9Q6C3_9TELE|nr:PREDICTED: tandem C2 domains nuclear protein-like [Notothenia coriiceps]